jgi:hypothetical protein
MNARSLMLVPMLCGCQQLLALHDAVDGWTDTFVIQGLYLGVEEPGDLDLSNTDWASSSRVTVFLADASQLDQVENAPITGAVVSLLSAVNGGEMTMFEDASGSYVLSEEEGLRYAQGESVSIVSDYLDIEHRLQVDLPASPDLSSLPLIHPVQTKMTVDLSGQDYDTALIVVLNTETGELTWSNEPKSVDEIYALSHPNGILLGAGEESEPIDVVMEIPRTAFPEEGMYAVGVAGIYVSNPTTFEGVNTALSNMMAGKFKLEPVCTEAYSMACEALMAQ